MARRKKLRVTLRKVRSALSNGSAIIRDVDHRSAWMRRLRDLIGSHERDLNPDTISEAERRLVRRAAMLTLQLEMMDAKFAIEGKGEATPQQLMLYQMVTNTLRRVLETLGLKRRPRDVTPLDQYLRRRHPIIEHGDDDGKALDGEAAE
jgi:hypothetical protein